MRKLIFLFVFLFLFMAADVSALIWSNNTFNNSLTNETFNFNGTNNFTRYLQIPSSVTFLTNGQFNISAFDINFSTLTRYFSLDETSGDAIGINGVHNLTNGAGIGQGVAGISNTAYNYTNLSTSFSQGPQVRVLVP